jgi:hypothetical protein
MRFLRPADGPPAAEFFQKRRPRALTDEYIGDRGLMRCCIRSSYGRPGGRSMHRSGDMPSSIALERFAFRQGLRLCGW